MATIDNLQLDIQVNDNASAKLSQLAEALSALKNSVTGAKLNGIANGISAIVTSVKGISSNDIHKIERLSRALERINGTSVAGLSAIGRSLNTVTQQQQPETTGTTENAPTAESATKTASAMDRVRTSIHNATLRLRVFRNHLAEISRFMGRTALQTIGRGFTRIGNAFARITQPFRNLIRSIGRIALYRLLRSIIKAITQGIKEGVENLARFSKLMNELDSNKANRVMSLYASNFLYLKNTLATAVIPILKTLEPIIDAVINRMISLINIIAQLFSAISGSSTYTKAKYFYIDYAESLDKASGSAGKLNKQLAKFDELNNLTTSQGSGSGYSDDDIRNMFEDPVPIAEWIQKLREFIEEGDWYSVGQTISLHLRDALREIDWNDIGDKAAQKGKGLAGFFNGLIRPDTSYEIGKALIGVINAGFRYFNAFASTMDWKNVGTSFAEFLNGIIQNAKPEELSEAINNMVQAFLDFAAGFFTNFDWKTALKNMFNVLSGLSPEAYALLVGVFLLRVFTAAGTTAGLNYGQSLAAAIVAGIGGYLIGNGLGQIWAAIIGDDDLLEEYQGLNPFTSGKTGETTYSFFEEEIFQPWSDYTLTGTIRNIKKNESERSIKQYKALNVELDKATAKLKAFYQQEKLGGNQMKKDVDEFLNKGIVPTYWSAELETAMREYKNYYDSFQSITYDDNLLAHLTTVWGMDFFKANGIDVSKNVEGIEEVDKALGDLAETLNGLSKDFSNLKHGGKETFGTLVKEAFGLQTSVARDIDNIISDIQRGNVNVESMGAAFGEIAKAVTTTDLQSILPFFKDSRWKSFYNIIKNNLSYEQFLAIGSNMGNGMSKSFANAMETIQKAYNAIKEQISKDPLHIDFKAIIDIVQTTYQQVVTDLTPKYTTENKTGMPSVVEEALNAGKTPTSTGQGAKVGKKLPTVPSYIPSNQASAWLEEWKRKNPADYYYAKGGFPSVGSLFVAGEAGAELVGNFNGRTGVANTDQIQGAMYAATYDAMSKALAENNTSIVLEGDADALFRVIQKKSQDFYTRTGRYAM